TWEHESDVEPVLELLGVEGVAPGRERELAGRIRPRAGPGDPGRRAGDVDDRDSPRPIIGGRGGASQQRKERLSQAYRGLEVELHVARDVRPTRVTEAPAPGRAGVVDQEVEPTVVITLDDLPNALRRIVVGQVGRDHGRAADLVRQPLELLLA